MTVILDSAIAAASRLVWPWTHAERLDDGRTHYSRHPGLIQQLRIAAGAADAPEDWRPPVFGPKAPVREEPFGVLHDIGRLAPTLAARCGSPLRTTLEGTLAGVVGALGRLAETDLKDAEQELTGLVVRAEQALNWRLHSRRLRGNCPACASNDSVIVRLDDHGPADAVCTKCSAEWDRTRLGILAGAMSQTRPNTGDTVETRPT